MNHSQLPPIPSYDEVIAANPMLSQVPESSQSYRSPTVRNARRSEDSLFAPDDDDDDDDDTITSIASSDIDDYENATVDDLDYQGVELEELGTSARRRNRRQIPTSGWKGRLSNFTKRVSRWKLWQGNFHLPASIPRLPCPNLPEGFVITGPVIARFLGLIVLIGIAWAFFALAVFPSSQNEMLSMYDLESVRAFAQTSVDINRLRGYLDHVSSFDHVAGTSGSYWLAEWMKDAFIKAGLERVGVDEYQVHLNYPKPEGRRIAIISPPELAQDIKFSENPAYPDQTLVGKANTQAFHGLSKNGTAKGPLIYFNYGHPNDYKTVCESWNIDCSSSIAIIRRHPEQADIAWRIKEAEKYGILAVITFSDKHLNRHYDFPLDTVQRESVALSNMIIGDVLTPGWASVPEAKRKNQDDNPALIRIPSLPISFTAAETLLASLNNHGNVLPSEWTSDAARKWFSGDHNSPIIELVNDQDDIEKQKIFNVMGRIDGIEPDSKSIVIGTHRDSWCFGAADSGSGTAILLEIIAIIGQLKSQGWRPLRSIVFASWDAKDYNMIGSTEWVEDHINELRRDAVAYLNIDIGVSGPNFKASASPLLTRSILTALDRVSDPVTNASLIEAWNQYDGKISALDSQGDYNPFQNLAGVSSLDIGFRGKNVPLHSCYETIEWMNNIGDPGLVLHESLTKVWILLLLEFSQNYLVPFDLMSLKLSLQDKLTWLDTTLQSITPSSPKITFDTTVLHEAIDMIHDTALERDQWETSWFGQVYGTNTLETNGLAALRRAHNNRITDFETGLLDIIGNDPAPVSGIPIGIPGRDQFKHVLVGPSLHPLTVAGEVDGWFPFIVDALQKQDWALVQAQIAKTGRILKEAVHKLKVEN